MKYDSLHYRFRVTLIAMIAAGTACALTAQTPAPITHTYEFFSGSGGMLPLFTDYSLATSDFRFQAERRNLPNKLPQDYKGRSSFFLCGNNRSDDLFMGLKSVLTPANGVVPNQQYTLHFDIEFASNSASCPGIGGSQGDSVFLKAGGSTLEPVPLLMADQYVSINVDKGHQQSSGFNLGTVDNISNGRACDNPGWVLLKKSYQHPSAITASPSGDLWISVGTESGYEGLTDLYYRVITVTLTPLKR